MDYYNVVNETTHSLHCVKKYAWIIYFVYACTAHNNMVIYITSPGTSQM